MNKNDDIRTARAKYVKKCVSESKNCTKVVKKLAKELFLSERTIERDLKR